MFQGSRRRDSKEGELRRWGGGGGGGGGEGGDCGGEGCRCLRPFPLVEMKNYVVLKLLA